MNNPIKKIITLVLFIFLSSSPFINAFTLNIPDNENEAQEYIQSLLNSKIQNPNQPQSFDFLQKFLDALYGNPLKEEINSPNYLTDLINFLLTHPRSQVQEYTLVTLQELTHKNSIDSALITKLNLTKSMKALLLHKQPEILLETLNLLEILLKKKLIDTLSINELNLEKSLTPLLASLKKLEEKNLISSAQVKQIQVKTLYIIRLLLQKIKEDSSHLEFQSQTKDSDQESDL